VQPHPGTVRWARGELPTPHGGLYVAWQRGDGAFTLTVRAPQGTSGTVSVPVAADSDVVRLDGHAVTGSTSRGYRTVQVEAGAHHITVTHG
jgi:hypothetical protein